MAEDKQLDDFGNHGSMAGLSSIKAGSGSNTQAPKVLGHRSGLTDELSQDLSGIGDRPSSELEGQGRQQTADVVQQVIEATKGSDRPITIDIDMGGQQLSQQGRPVVTAAPGIGGISGIGGGIGGLKPHTTGGPDDHNPITGHPISPVFGSVASEASEPEVRSFMGQLSDTMSRDMSLQAGRERQLADAPDETPATSQSELGLA